MLTRRCRLLQWSRQPAALHALVAFAFTVFAAVKWGLYHGHNDAVAGTGVPAAAGVFVFAPLSLWMLVGNVSRFWKPSTRAQLAASEVGNLQQCAVWAFVVWDDGYAITC